MAGPAPSARSLAAALHTLGQLPCPSIGVGDPTASATAAAVAAELDVVVGSEAELPALEEAVGRTPLAASALVQLLRHNRGLDSHDGLIAESLVYSTLQSGPEFSAWRATRPAPRARPANPEPAVLVQRSAQRLELTLNRPEKRNAFSAEMRDGLVEGLQIALADSSLEVVLRGAGSAFCAGGDLDEFGTLPDPATAHTIRSTRNAARLLAACGDRVRVEVHGACVGAGMELPAFARQVVAHPDAVFSLPELAMGLVPGAGGTVSIPRRIGRQRTAYLALTGTRLDAATALEWGLVDRVTG